MTKHRTIPDRVVMLSETDGGRLLRVIADVVRGDTLRPVSALGGEEMTAKRTAAEATKPPSRNPEPMPADGQVHAADYYDQTHDLSRFDGGEAVELESTPAGTRNVTLSIRLSPEELQTLGQRAAAAGMKLTAYIRGAALQAEAPPVDDDLLDTAAEVVDLIAALRTSVEAAKARRQQATSNTPTAATAS